MTLANVNYILGKKNMKMLIFYSLPSVNFVYYHL